MPYLQIFNVSKSKFGVLTVIKLDSTEFFGLVLAQFLSILLSISNYKIFI